MVGGVEGFRCGGPNFLFPRSDPAFHPGMPLRPWWDPEVSNAVESRLISSFFPSSTSGAWMCHGQTVGWRL